MFTNSKLLLTYFKLRANPKLSSLSSESETKSFVTLLDLHTKILLNLAMAQNFTTCSFC